MRRLVNETDLPLIEVGGIRTRQQMQDVLDAGAKAFSVSRPLICDPDFPAKLRDTDDVVSGCKGCGFCYKPLDHSTQIRCPIAGKIR